MAEQCKMCTGYGWTSRSGKIEWPCPTCRPEERKAFMTRALTAAANGGEKIAQALGAPDSESPIAAARRVTAERDELQKEVDRLQREILSPNHDLRTTAMSIIDREKTYRRDEEQRRIEAERHVQTLQARVAELEEQLADARTFVVREGIGGRWVGYEEHAGMQMERDAAVIARDANAKTIEQLRGEVDRIKGLAIALAAALPGCDRVQCPALHATHYRIYDNGTREDVCAKHADSPRHREHSWTGPLKALMSMDRDAGRSVVMKIDRSASARPGSLLDKLDPKKSCPHGYQHRENCSPCSTSDRTGPATGETCGVCSHKTHAPSPCSERDCDCASGRRWNL